MARLVFPDEGSRMAYRVQSTALVSASGATAVFYTNAAATTLADVRVHDGTAAPGAALAGSSVTVDAYSRLPLLWGPDGVDTLYVVVSGGPATPVYARVDDRIDAIVTSRPVNAKDHGVVGNGVVDDTSAAQSAIDAAVAAGRPVIWPPGTILTGPLNLNGTGHATPADAQWTGVAGFFGAGRGSTVFKAKPGAYVAGVPVLSHRNVAGAVVKGFRIDAAGVATVGADFSWTGGSAGNPALAPSNVNSYEDIWVEGASSTSINFNQQYDAKLTGIWVRGSSGVGISCIAPGGMLSMSHVIVSAGTLDVACQNASFVGCGFFGGVILKGAGYNTISWVGTHIYPNPATGASIDSQATGASTRGMVFTGAYFPPATNIVKGRYHEGIEFIGCNFPSYTVFFGTVTPAGTDRPVFVFRGSSFGSAPPADVASQTRVRIEHCLNSAGGVIDRHAWVDYAPAWKAGATAVTIGNGSIVAREVRRGDETSVRIWLKVGSTTVIPAGVWSFALPRFTAAVGTQVGSMWILDAGARHYVGTVKVNGGDVTIQAVHTEATGAGLVDNASPQVWAVDDEMAIEITFEHAT